MIEEQNLLLKEKPYQKPPGIGMTILVSIDGEDKLDFVKSFREVWFEVAGWGRWMDEDLGDWPSNDEIINRIPEYLREKFNSMPIFELDNWSDDIHDRNWIVWSISSIGSFVKIDLKCESTPISWWVLEFVVNKLGGRVHYTGEWLAENDIEVKKKEI